jgi:hypothetical protein
MRRRILMSCALLAALIVLVLASCGTTQHVTTMAISTSTPPRALTWRLLALPANASLMRNAGFTASSEASHTAWACAPDAHGVFTVWALHSPQGAWQEAGTLTPTALLPVNGCFPIADQVDPNTLALGVQWGCGECGTFGMRSYLSTDVGAHWHPLGATMTLSAMGEVGGHTFAILRDSSVTYGPQGPGLVVSDDHLRTWRPVRISGATGQANSLWVSPTGDLLVAIGNVQLWHSSDHGATWSMLSGSAVPPPMVTWLTARAQWYICFPQAALSDEVSCSADLGATWHSQQALNRVIGCGACLKGAQPFVCTPRDLAADGSLLAFCPPKSADMTSGATPPMDLLRLTPESAAWVDLGVAPGHTVAAWDDGTLWAVNGQSGAVYTTTLPG